MNKTVLKKLYTVFCICIFLGSFYPVVTVFAEGNTTTNTKVQNNGSPNSNTTANNRSNQNQNTQTKTGTNGKSNSNNNTNSPTNDNNCAYYDAECLYNKYISPSVQQRLDPTSSKIDPNNPNVDDCDHWYDLSCQLSIYFYYESKASLFGSTEILDSFLFKAHDVSADPAVKYYLAGFQKISWTFLLLFLSYQLVRILSMYAFQENQSQLMPLLRKVIFAAVMIGSLPWICGKLVTLNNDLVDAIVAGATVSKHLNPLVSYTQNKFTYVLMIILAVSCLIVAFQMLVRYAELALLIAIGPIAISTILNQEFNLFPSWWRNVLSVIFTQAIQVLILVMGIKMVMDVKSITGQLKYFYIIGFFIVLIKTPKFLKEWMHSTGTLQLAQTVASTLTKFI